jgi:hypothetical protein
MNQNIHQKRSFGYKEIDYFSLLQTFKTICSFMYISLCNFIQSSIKQLNERYIQNLYTFVFHTTNLLLFPSFLENKKIVNSRCYYLDISF